MSPEFDELIRHARFVWLCWMGSMLAFIVTAFWLLGTFYTPELRGRDIFIEIGFGIAMVAGISILTFFGTTRSRAILVCWNCKTPLQVPREFPIKSPSGKCPSCDLSCVNDPTL